MLLGCRLQRERVPGRFLPLRSPRGPYSDDFPGLLISDAARSKQSPRERSPRAAAPGSFERLSSPDLCRMRRRTLAALF